MCMLKCKRKVPRLKKKKKTKWMTNFHFTNITRLFCYAVQPGMAGSSEINKRFKKK